KSLSTTTNGFSGISINSNGQIIANSGGALVLTDENLASFSTINVGTSSVVGTFVTWVQPPVTPVPEPPSLVLIAACLATVCLAAGWRRFRPAALASSALERGHSSY